MQNVYVDPVHGSDSAPGDGSESHPWRTIQKAFDSHLADTDDVNCNIIGDGVTCDAGTYLNFGHANTHWFVVRPYVGLYPRYAQAYKIANSGAQAYILRCTAAASAKWRFENAEFTPTAGQSCILWGEGTVTDPQFVDCLLPAGSTLGKVITNYDLYIKTRPLFRRCKFHSTVSNVGSAAVVFENTADLLLDSCIGTFVGNGVYIGDKGNPRARVIGTHDPANGTYHQWVAVSSAGNQGACPLAIGTSGGAALSVRNVDILVEGALVVGDGYSHVLMLDADGCVARYCTCFMGAGGTVNTAYIGLGMVCKWGVGYSIYGNAVYSGAPTAYNAETHPGIYTTTPADKTQGIQPFGVLFKGVVDVSFFANLIDVEGSDGTGYHVFGNSDSGGRSLSKNISITRNRIVTGGTSRAWMIQAVDPAGFLDVDCNEYTLGGTGVSSLWARAIVTEGPETLSAIQSAWLNGPPLQPYSSDPADASTGYAVYPMAWRSNDSHAYPLVAAANVVNGIDRGDGVVGTYPTTAATQAAELALLDTTENKAKILAGKSIALTAGSVAGAFDLSIYTPIASVVDAADVRAGVSRYQDGGNGTCHVPATSNVRYGVPVDASIGDLRLPNSGNDDEEHWAGGNAALVALGAHFDAANAGTGSAVLTQDEVASAVSTIGANVGTLLARLGTPAVGSTIAGQTEKLDTIAPRIDAAISTRLAADNYTAPPTDYQQRGVAVTLPAAPDGYGGAGASEIAAAVMDEAKGDHTGWLTTLAPTDALPTTAGIPAAVWSHASRTLTGLGGVAIGPTAATSVADIYATVFRGSSVPLSARVLLANGVDATIADITTITYTIFAEHDCSFWTAITNHVAVAVEPSAVLFDALQSDGLATGYNFRHMPDVSAHSAFAEPGRYVVEYKLLPRIGQAIIVRFKVHSI